MLSDAEKRFLLKVARNSIEAAVNDLPPEKINACPEELMKPSGAFVTLLEDDELRGCIGYTENTQSLITTVQEVAVKAAMEDPRFIALSADELSRIEIEISVISPLRLIDRIEEIGIGRHGLVMEWKTYRGLLLPQVPVEYGWDTETFLMQTAKKAGLPPNAWKYPETKLFTFSAEVFSERSFERARH